MSRIPVRQQKSQSQNPVDSSAALVLRQSLPHPVGRPTGARRALKRLKSGRYKCAALGRQPGIRKPTKAMLKCYTQCDCGRAYDTDDVYQLEATVELLAKRGRFGRQETG